MRYLFLVLIFLLNSCSQNYADKLPNWYLKPQANDANYLYGVAYAGSLEQAEKLALKALAEKLAITIAAEYELRQQQNIVNEQELYETRSDNKITTQLNKIKFENFENLQTEKIADKIYVQVRVSRAELIEQFLTELEQLTNKITQQYQANKNTSLAKNFIIFAQLAPTLAEAQEKLAMLKTLGTNDSLRAPYQKIISDLSQAALVNKQKLKFQIVAKPADQRFADIFAKQVNQQNFVVVKQLASDDQGQPQIKINTVTKQQKIYGAYQVKITLTLRLLEHYGNQLASNKLIISGSSVIDENSAIDNALEKLTKQLAEQKLLNILGVKIDG